MDKTVIGLVAAIGAIAPLTSAQASTQAADLGAAMEVSSFADLLQPIPNALAILKASDEQETANPAEGVQVAQLVVHTYHHHHHHHVYVYRHHHHHYRYHHHHHHLNY